METDDSKDEVGVEEITHIGQLIPDPQNARSHNERNIKQIVDSLQEVGAARSIVLDEDNIVLAGNGVIEAAGIAGIENVRVVEADGNEIIAVKRRGLTPEQKRRLALWDNRAGELAEWNLDQLEVEYNKGNLSNLFRPDEIEELFDGRDGAEFSDVDEESEKRVLGDKNKQIKPVLYADQIEIFEKAIQATTIKNRGDAIVEICKHYLGSELI